MRCSKVISLATEKMDRLLMTLQQMAFSVFQIRNLLSMLIVIVVGTLALQIDLPQEHMVHGSCGQTIYQTAISTQIYVHVCTHICLHVYICVYIFIYLRIDRYIGTDCLIMVYTLSSESQSCWLTGEYPRICNRWGSELCFFC